MSTFRSYDSFHSLGRQPPKACEECHLRKVRCIPGADGATCEQCSKHGTECRQRSRKRRRTKATENDSPRSQSAVLQRGQDATGAHFSVDDGAEQIHGRRPPPLLFTGGRRSTNSSPATLHSLDRFHNSSYLCRTAILGQDFHDIDHTHGGNAAHQYTLSSTDLQMLQLYQAFDLPEQPERQSLIEACYDKCWTWMPVFDQSALVEAREGEISYLLLQAVLLAGSLMRPHRYSSSVVEALYKRVKALLHSGHERNPLNVLAALCYIQWYPSPAPKDISLDSPRFWTTMAIGIAQQMGLHRKAASSTADEGLRRRLWWALRTKDSLSASAHGRPRHVNSLDCTQPPLSLEDFPDSRDNRAHICISYVSIVEILGDLCQLMARKGDATWEEKNDVAARLSKYLDTLDPRLRLIADDGSAMPYSLDIAQLHIHILATISILYRSKSMFSLAPSNAASVAAANLSFRIFEAIELREHTHCLSSAFAWHLLVAATPLLSCLRLSALSESAGSALDSLEKSLNTLGMTRPAAVINLRNVRAIRKAMASSLPPGRRDEIENTADRIGDMPNHLTLASSLLRMYGSDAGQHYDDLIIQLGHHNASRASPAGSTADRGEGAQVMSTQQQDFLGSLGIGSADDQFNLEDLFGAGHSWIMKDWMDDLQTGTY